MLLFLILQNNTASVEQFVYLLLAYKMRSSMCALDATKVSKAHESQVLKSMVSYVNKMCVY